MNAEGITHITLLIYTGMQNINSQWITPYVKSSAFNTCMPLEEGDPTWRGFYLNIWFYILCRDLGGIAGKAEWSVVSNVTLPGPRAESIMRISWMEVQEEEASKSNTAGFAGQIIHMLDQLWNDNKNDQIWTRCSRDMLWLRLYLS